MPPDPPKTSAECHPSRIRREMSRFYLRLKKNISHKPTRIEIIFLLNYYNICHKINKPLNLDIQVNSELQS